MKNHIARFVSVHFAAALTLAACVIFSTPSAHAKTKLCYLIADDFDRDGYAKPGAKAVSVTVDELALTCPQDRYVDKAGDCNDFNGAVHPRTREISYNGTDDNCNGLADEPTYSYRADGINNRTTGFTMMVHLNHTRIRNAAIAGKLWVRIGHFRLRDSGDSYGLRYAAPVTAFTPGYYTAAIELNQLESGTLYAARLHFFELSPRFELIDIGPNGDIVGDGTGELYDTERFYTMTDSELPNVHNRFQVVMKALAEYNSSEWGEVGYYGAIDRNGTRYGAGGNRRWCSEFYSWNATSRVANIAGLDSYNDLISFFRDRSALFNPDNIPTASPGDYLPLDTDQDGDINHSAMFLAYDDSKAEPQVWTLEGNSANTVDVVARKADWDLPVPADKAGRVFRYLGRIRSTMWR